MKKNALLALADGTVFWGESFGAQGAYAGELVFNTAQTGYQEILTDPSYAAQIIVFSSPHIGVVGVNDQDAESPKIWAGGCITRAFSVHTSNWRANNSLANYLMQHGKIGISGIDTRALTHLLREKGAQNAYIMAGQPDPEYAVKQAKMFIGLSGLDLTPLVSCKKAYALALPHPGVHHQVVVMDFGVKQSILDQLHKASCDLIIVPASSTVDEILCHSPDGIFLSNGPGDPAACSGAISVIKALLDLAIPTFGICLGHQLLALASGARTEKMLLGHHGANHPILDLAKQEVFISSQNHGFVVAERSLPRTLKVTHRSLFDKTIAGIERTDKPAFGFQGHPEASPGPMELQFLFQKFAFLMERNYAKAH